MHQIIPGNDTLGLIADEQAAAIFELADRQAAKGSRSAQLLLDHSPGRGSLNDFTLIMALSMLSEALEAGD